MGRPLKSPLVDNEPESVNLATAVLVTSSTAVNGPGIRQGGLYLSSPKRLLGKKAAEQIPWSTDRDR